jgi:Domain of unknown function (DUF4126)
MTALQALTGLLGMSFASGVNLYAAILLVGLGIRFDFLHGLPHELAPLAHPAVLAAAGVMYFLEFFADKIPVLMTLWDVLHTVVRPIGAVAVALVASRDLDPVTQLLIAILGGSVALASHSTKMGIRLVAHTTGEPFTQIGLSLAEDAFAVGLLLLVYKYPMAALIVILTLLALIAWLTPLLYRTLRFLFAGMSGRLRSWFAPRTPGAAAIPCYARRVRGAPLLKKGHLTRAENGIAFCWTRFGRPNRLLLPSQYSISTGAIYDQVSTGGARIYLTKDWSRLL